MTDRLSHWPQAPQESGLVDLLEIYHARQLRNLVARQALRLQDQSRSMTDGDALDRAEELAGYYEALAAHLNQLLLVLGDGPCEAR